LCLVWLAAPGDICEKGCPHAAVKYGAGICLQRDECLRLAAGSGRDVLLRGVECRRIPFNAHVRGRIPSGERQPVIVRDLTSDCMIFDLEWAAALGLKSFAGFPLHSSGGEILGMLAVFSNHAISEEEVVQMESLSSAAIHVILGSQAEAALRQSEERFRLIAETVNEVFWMLDVVEEKPLYISSAFEKIWGCSRQPVYEDRKAFRRALHPEDAERAIKAFGEQKTGRPYEIEYRIIRPDGTVRHIWDRGFPVPNPDGQVRVYVGVAQDVTEWKEAEARLRKSSEYLNNLLNCIGDPIFVKDRQHRFIFSNDANCAFIGRPREEVIGKTGIENLDNESVAMIMEREERLFQTGKANIDTEVLERKDGSKYEVMVHKTLLIDGDGKQQIVGTLKDITDLKRIENELRESEARLSSIINAAQDGIIMMDEEGRATLFSPAAERITGYSATEVAGHNLFQLHFPAHLLPVYRSMFAEWLQTDQSRPRGRTLEMNLTRKNGADISIELSLAPLREKECWRTVGIIRDITERKRIQEECDRMEMQLLQAQKLEAIGQLAAGVAHEINTPTQYVGDNTRFLKEAVNDFNRVLHSCARLLEANRDGRVDSKLLEETEAVIKAVDLDYLLEEAPKAISQSLDGVSRIANIVRAMKEFSHPGSRSKQAVDLNRAIENTLTVCRNEWKYVAEMDVSLDPALFPVLCMPGEINQVFLNLIINAAHAIAEATENGERGKGRIG
ncbi:MAG TPA: PAS domain S-box protein, partial [Acidobacteriota bacterium]|nr:PAS domain S-box protein [Acidobacteriota bacterium]